jgi:hypothetical protein
MRKTNNKYDILVIIAFKIIIVNSNKNSKKIL